MVEKWVATVRNKAIAPAFAKLARIWAFSPGLWISGAVVLFMCFLTIRAHPFNANYRRQMAAAYGAANTFYGAPQMNRDGSKFTYVSTTEQRGCALYLFDTVTKETRQIAFEKDGLGAWHDEYELKAWPWAPDDSAVLYTMRDKLVVFPLNTNVEPAELKVRTDAVAELIWLSPSRLVWIQKGGDHLYSGQQVNGVWKQQVCPFPRYDEIGSLTPVSSNTFAWLQDGFICRADVDAIMVQQTAKPGPASDSAPLPDSLVLWLDASKLQLTNQSPVYQLPDLSVNRNNAVTNVNPPLFNATNSPGALNGKGTIHFASGAAIGKATGLKTKPLGIKGSAPRSIFAVMRRQQGKEMLINTGKMGAAQEYFGLVDNDRGLSLPAGQWVENRAPATSSRWNILSVVYDGTTQRGFVNGVLKGVSSFTVNTPDVEVELGIRVPKNGNMGQAARSDGDFAELLIYDRALSVTEQQEVENYLSLKWFAGAVITVKNPLVWVNPGVKGITDFTYSKATGQLLLYVEEGPQKSFWRYDAVSGASKVAKVEAVSNPQWINSTNFVYVTERTGQKEIVVTDTHGYERSRFHGGNIRLATFAGDKCLFVGIVSNQPNFGIWQYDLNIRALQSIVSYSERPFADAKTVPSYRGYIRADSLSCMIYTPLKIEPGKKYPLVISDTVTADAIHGPVFQSAIAGSGAYVAIVERGYWAGGIKEWATNVLNLYEVLKRDSTIDLNRVYLFGASAETEYLSQFVEEKPEPWRGLILLNPGKLPDFSNSPRFAPRPKILLSAGEKEKLEPRFKKYQEDMLKQGVLVEYHIGAGETHRFVGKDAKRERAEAVERFIFEE